MEKTALSKALRVFRVMQGDTIVSLAERAGVSKDVPSKLENGNLAVRLENFLSVADALGLEVSVRPKDGLPLDLAESVRVG